MLETLSIFAKKESVTFEAKKDCAVWEWNLNRASEKEEECSVLTSSRETRPDIFVEGRTPAHGQLKI